MSQTLFLVVLALCSVFVTGSDISPQILQQVTIEDMYATVMVDFSLKIRNAMSTMSAAQSYSQILQQVFQQRPRNLEEVDQDDNEEDFEVESYLEIGRDFEETLFGEDSKTSKLSTYAAYQFLLAMKYKFYQTIIKAREVQNNFWLDRSVQLQLLSSGTPNAQQLQLLYFKFYRTYLETQKFSLTLQYISSFYTWLEDELDVHSDLSDSKSDRLAARDQGDDLIEDKIYAFTAYHSAASLELQAFYLDMMLSYYGSSSQPAAPITASATASFLEEKETEGVEAQPSESQFFPFMGQQNPVVFLTYFKLYYLMVQYAGARAALTSVYAEKLAYEREHVDLYPDAKKITSEQATKYRRFAQDMFGGEFANNLYQGAQIKYMTSMWEWYMMFSAFSAAQQPQGAATTAAAGTTKPL